MYADKRRRLLKNDTLNGELLDVQTKLTEMKKKEELIKKHPYAISEGKDGYWRTYLPDDAKGRRLVKRKTEDALKDVIAEYWRQEIENPTVKEIFYKWVSQKRSLKYISNDTYYLQKNRALITF